MKTNNKKIVGFLTLLIIFCTVFTITKESKAIGYGEDNSCLGQYVDDFENNNNFTVMSDTIVNTTLDCVELEYEISGGNKVYENYSEYTEVDALNRITIVSDTQFQHDSYRDEDNRLYYDYSVNYFDDFEHWISIYMNSMETLSIQIPWFLSDYTIKEQSHFNNYPFIAIRVYRNSAGSGGTREIQIYEHDGTTSYADKSNAINLDVWYYLSIFKEDTNFTCAIYTDSNRTALFDTISLTLQSDYKFRYIISPNTKGQSGYHYLADADVKDLWIGKMSSGYDLEGYCITTNCFDYCNGSSLVLLTNATLNSGTITVQFSNDNLTWVDHEGNAGSDLLIDGFYSLDLRDLNYTTLYRMYNFTTPANTNTPRLYQERVITTIGNCTGGGIIVTNVLFYPIILYGILGIFFICGIVALSKHGRLRL